MTGSEFENIVCKILRAEGDWVLRIPRNEKGAQPFDILSIRRPTALAIDCKVCEANRFPLSRVEDNQWLAFEDFEKRAGCASLIILHKRKIYSLPFAHLRLARTMGQASVAFLDDRDFHVDDKGNICACLSWDEDHVFELIGRKL